MSSIAKQYNRDIRYMFIENLKGNNLDTAINFLETSNRTIYQLYASKLQKRYSEYGIAYANELAVLTDQFYKVEHALETNDYKNLVNESIMQWQNEYKESLMNYRISQKQSLKKVDKLLTKYFE